MDIVLAGFQDALSLSAIFYVGVGVFMGLMVGAVPGLSAPMAIALAVPLTYHMSAVAAIGFLIGINKGGFFGGSISAVLLNAPGTAEAAATAYDGYPLATQGKGLKAIKMALYASTFGDVFSTILLIVVAGPVASMALHMGPPELFSIIVFALSLIAALESRSLAMGLAAAALGMLIGTIGMDPVVGEPRLTFGFFQFESGVSLVSMSIGLLALSEIIAQSEDFQPAAGGVDGDAMLDISDNPDDRRVSWAEFLATKLVLLKSSLVGAGIGALPGLGSTVATFLAYGMAKSSSKKPEAFGKGSLEGIAAAESANNAVIGAALIPLFTLGIPGNIASALLIGAFMLHGVAPGPLMFEQNGRLVYGVYGTMIVGNILLLALGYLCIRLFTKLLSAPKIILLPVILYICVVGAYLSENSAFGVGVMVLFGALGYLMKKVQFSFVCFIVGFILVPMLELSFQQTVIAYSFNPWGILERYVAVGMFVFTIVFCVLRNMRWKKTQ